MSACLAQWVTCWVTKINSSMEGIGELLRDDRGSSSSSLN